MLRNAVLIVAIVSLASVALANRDEFELEDTVTIVALDRELMAHATGRGARKLRLEPGERLIWHGARGRIGFAVSDRRILGFHASTGWSDRALRVAEASPASPELSSRLALFVTSQRAIAFDGHWREESIGPTEGLRTVSVGSGAALVLTNRRALGVAPGFGFVAVNLGIHESVEVARTVASSAEVRTSQRVLFFSGPSGGWTEQKRSLH